MDCSMGRQIAERRKALGLTQDQLAERLGVTKQAVSKWENELCYPDITMLPELAQIFGCTIDTLFGLTGQQTASPDPPESVQEENASWKFSLSAVERKHGCMELVWHGPKITLWEISLWVILIGLADFAGEAARNKGMGQTYAYWNLAWMSALMVYGIHGLRERLSISRLLFALSGAFLLLESVVSFPVQLNSGLRFPAALILLGFLVLVKQIEDHKIFKREEPIPG